MREFDFNAEYQKLLTPEVVAYLTQIHEYKGQQNLFIEAKADALSSLLDVARIQSTEASNRIEGIITTDDRLKKIVREKTMPQSRSEKEIAGYRDVLATIHESHDYIPPKPTVILQLHRDLYKFSGKSIGGSFKNSDNVIAEIDSSGQSRVRFQPLSAFETPDAVERLTNTFVEAIRTEKYDPLLLVPLFILDFLCIHPFNDGNGRMSRLLTLLLLYRSGYIVGKYISVEMIIEKTKETYYEVLQESSAGWYEGKNAYLPFVKYYLEVILSAYKEFSARVQLMQDRSLSKPERIRRLFANTLQKLSKGMILEKCPDISASTVEATLAALVKEGYIIKIGAGKTTAYIRNTDLAKP